MNLATTISIHGGGPGSGCQGPNCGRKPTGKDVKDLMNEHDSIKGHRFREDEPNERLYKMQQLRISALNDRIESIFGKTLGNLELSGTFTLSEELEQHREMLDKAESYYAKGKLADATGVQEGALAGIHDVLEQLGTHLRKRK